MDEKAMEAIAKALAEELRHRGPTQRGGVFMLLRDRGLSPDQALSTLAFAVDKGLVARLPGSGDYAVGDEVRGCKRSVLLVEDDVGLARTLRQVLEEEGYDVRHAANGAEAVHELESDRPCVILLDLMMPVMNGWDVLAHLSHDPALSHIPVAVVSASTGLDGLNATVLHKPVDLSLLLSTVEESCARPARSA